MTITALLIRIVVVLIVPLEKGINTLPIMLSIEILKLAIILGCLLLAALTLTSIRLTLSMEISRKSAVINKQ